MCALTGVCVLNSVHALFRTGNPTYQDCSVFLYKWLKQQFFDSGEIATQFSTVSLCMICLPCLTPLLVDLQNSPAAPAGIRTRNLSITSPSILSTSYLGSSEVYVFASKSCWAGNWATMIIEQTAKSVRFERTWPNRAICENVENLGMLIRERTVHLTSCLFLPHFTGNPLHPTSQWIPSCTHTYTRRHALTCTHTHARARTRTQVIIMRMMKYFARARFPKEMGSKRFTIFHPPLHILQRTPKKKKRKKKKHSFNDEPQIGENTGEGKNGSNDRLDAGSKWLVYSQ